MQTKFSRRTQIAALSTIIFAVALIAGATLSPTKPVSSLPPATMVAAPVPMVGVATGEFANGVPVYRLPTVTVAVSRSEALAQIANEERLASK